jgi:hypothetical protein
MIDVAILSLLWLSQVLYLSALILALFNGTSGKPDKTFRYVYALALMSNAAMFIFMIITNRYPTQYEYMNCLTKSFFTALIAYVGTKGRKSNLPAAISLIVALFFSLSSMHLTMTLELGTGMPHGFEPYIVLFFQLISLSIGFFGYCFALSVSHMLGHEENGKASLWANGAICKAALGGFVCFTFSQLFGSVWSLTGGWGDVWIWGSSHIYSAMIWIFYAGMLHVPAAEGLPKKALPAMGVIGFSIIVFYMLYSEYSILPMYKAMKAAWIMTASGIV